MSSANQSIRSPRCQIPTSVDPAAEVRRGGDVRADRDDVRGDLGRGVREVDEEAAERLLGRGAAAVGAAEVGRGAGAARQLDRLARAAGRRPPRHSSRLGRAVGEPRPRVGRVGARSRRPAAPTARPTAAPSGWPDGPGSPAATP